MKKFFKALALVLALVLVVGSIPVAAATEFSLTDDKDGKKIIYIGGSNGENEDGKKCSSKKYYDFTKHIAGFDSETMDLKFDKVGDKSIVSTKNASDRVYAKAIGTTDVTIGVYNKETGKLINNVKVKVQVKKNAEDVNYSFKNEEGGDVDLSGKVGVNVKYIVTLTRKDANGNMVDTDARSLTCDSDKVKIEPINAPYNTQYAVTFEESGDFVLKANAYQSSKYNKVLKSEDIKVTVGYDAVDLAQSSLNSYKVTFKQPVQNLEAKDFNIYYIVPGTDSHIKFSSIDGKPDCKENVATVKMRTDFVQGTTYYVEYAGDLVGQFEAIKVDANSVDHVEILTTTVEVKKLTEIQYKLVNADGIDVTSAKPSVLKGTLSFEIENKDVDTYTSGSKIYIGTVDKTYNVKATYKWYDQGSADPKTATGEGKITSVAAPVWEIGTVSAIVTKADAKNYVNADGSLSDVTTFTWTMSEAVSGAALQIAVPYTKGNDKMTDTFATTNGKGIYEKYVAESADSTVVMIGKADGSQKLPLIACKKGEADIIIYGMPKGKTAVKDGTPIYVIHVVVEGPRQAKDFTVTFAGDKNTLNKAYAGDKVTLNLSLKDQYGDAVNITKVKVEKTAGDANFTFSPVIGSAIKEVVINPSMVSAAGAINLKVTANDNFNQEVFINVGDESTTDNIYTLRIDGATALKSGVSFGTDLDAAKNQATIKLGRITPGGYAQADVSGLEFTDKRPEAGEASATGHALGFVYTVANKDGKLIDANSKEFKNNFSGNTFVPVKMEAGIASGAAIKLPAGEYTVEAFYVFISGDSREVQPLGSATFTVENNQVVPTVSPKAGNAIENITKPINNANIAAAFDVKFDGKDAGFEKTFTFQPNGDGTTAYVSKLVVRIPNDKVGYVDVPVDLDYLVKTK